MAGGLGRVGVRWELACKIRTRGKFVLRLFPCPLEAKEGKERIFWCLNNGRHGLEGRKEDNEKIKKEMNTAGE